MNNILVESKQSIKTFNLDESFSKKLVELERKKAEIEEEEKKLKLELLESMKANGINKIEDKFLHINYVAPVIRESFDSKKFKSENIELYNQYIKKISVNESLKIKLLG